MSECTWMYVCEAVNVNVCVRESVHECVWVCVDNVCVSASVCESVCVCVCV